MGLAGPRRRTKFNNDPNNTTWSRSVGFGQGLLLSQGWKPGQTLGARDAKHAPSYTAGSSSHIRILLRQENLGLGAAGAGDRNGTNSTGLDAFQGVLGRLNGKSEDVLEREQRARDNVKARVYAEGKWGGLRFIRGGTLHGDDFSYPDAPISEEKEAESQSSDDEATKVRRKAAKQARKEEKRRRKAEKAQRKLERAARKAAAVATKATPADSKLPTNQSSALGVAAISTKDESSLAPVNAQHSRGRHAVRQRHIKRNRMALTDAKALNEILMVRS